MYRSSSKSRSRLRSNLSESDLTRRGGKFAPSTYGWGVPLAPLKLTRPQLKLTVRDRKSSKDCLNRESNSVSRSLGGPCAAGLRRLNRRRIAQAAFHSLQSLVVLMLIGCGDSHSSIKEGLRVAEVGRSYPFHEVGREPWAMPKLFELPGYDLEWSESDELSEEDSLVDPIERPEALCGNGVVEAGEVCDLGLENGEWDEGRSLDALCTLNCQDPVWRGDLYLEEVSHRRLESLWVIDGDVHLDAHLPWGLMWRSLREIRGDIHFHHDSPVIHVDFPLLTHLTGGFNLNAFTAPHLESVQAPHLLRIGGDLHVRGHENIEALELDQLTHVGGDAVIAENASLEVLHLPVLQRVEHDFQVTDNPLLCEPWEMFEDWQWVSVYADMVLTRSNDCPFVVAQGN